MNNDINSKIKSIIEDKGIKLVKISEKTGIDYQRLNRLFNQKRERFKHGTKHTINNKQSAEF